MASNDDIATALREALVAPVAGLDVELVEVQVKGPRNKRTVRIVADALDTDDGLDVDRIADLSHAVSDLTDEHVVGAYTLEVTSPGVDRPLTTPRHFRRNLGREVEVRHARGDTDTQTTGTIAAVDDRYLELDAGTRGTVRIPFDEVFEGRIVLPW